MINVILSAISLGLLWSVMTLGVFITYRVLDYPDLTVEGSIATGAAIAAKLIISGVNPVLASLIATFGGMAAGMITGLLHTKLKIPGILSGILSMIALYSINIRIMGKANLTLLKSETVFTMAAKGEKVTSIIVIVCGAAIALFVIGLLFWFFKTALGSAVRATGSNEKMARAMGINTDTMKILGLVLSNGLVALSGALIAQNQSFADMQMGQGAIVIGLASVIIGEVLFYKTGLLNRLFAMVLGAVTYRIIIALVIEMGMNPTDLKLFTALTVVAALFLPTMQKWLIKQRDRLSMFIKKSINKTKTKQKKDKNEGGIAQ